jgi:hypothetical protein
MNLIKSQPRTSRRDKKSIALKGGDSIKNVMPHSRQSFFLAMRQPKQHETNGALPCIGRRFRFRRREVQIEIPVGSDRYGVGHSVGRRSAPKLHLLSENGGETLPAWPFQKGSRPTGIFEWVCSGCCGAIFYLDTGAMRYIEEEFVSPD